MPSVLLGPCADGVRLGGKRGLLSDPPYSAFQPCSGLATTNTCKPMELCKTRAKKRTQQPPKRWIPTPWDTLLLALVGGGVDGPIWVCRANKCSYPRETPIEAQGEYRWLDGSQIVQRHWDWLQTASAAVPFPAASLWEVAACPPHTYVPTTQHNLNQVSAPAP